MSAPTKGSAERISALAGKPAPVSLLVNVPRLLTAYFTLVPDPAVASQRVSFGTSGHRGSAFAAGFNEAHILAITQAVCLYRRHAGIGGPLFVGMDTHALSEPALASALEVLAANGVETMIDDHGTSRRSHPPLPRHTLPHRNPRQRREVDPRALAGLRRAGLAA